MLNDFIQFLNRILKFSSEPVNFENDDYVLYGDLMYFDETSDEDDWIHLDLDPFD